MTKNKLIKLIDEQAVSHIAIMSIKKALNEFFESNVCIPKGEDRHSYADVYHQYLEDTTIQLEAQRNDGVWIGTSISTLHDVRIKPSEPTYEYKVVMVYSDGKSEYTEKYFTVDEYREFGFPKTCTLGDSTKRIRQ
jgi:hypothetical protein